MKAFIQSLLLFLFTFSSLPRALAIRFESGDDIRISRPVREDLYVAAGTITIDAPVWGDLFVVGGNIHVNDTISGDLAAGGGTLYIRGRVLDDVRCAGGTVYILGNIEGDLLVTGGTVTLEPGATVSGDVYVAGGVLYLKGTVQGNLKTGSGEITLDGSVGKDADLISEKITINGSIGGQAALTAENLALGPDAAFKSNVRYWVPDGEFNFGDALQNGSTATFDPALEKKRAHPKPYFLGFLSVFAAMGYLAAMFILLAVGLRLFPNLFRKAAETAQADTIRALGLGVLYFLMVPVVVVTLFITIIGIPLGLIGLFFYILFLSLANVITALTGAEWLRMRQKSNWTFWQTALVALGFLVVLKLLWFIPFVGWLAKCLAVCIAFGAILLHSGLLPRREPSPGVL